MEILISTFIGVCYLAVTGYCQDIKIVTYWGQNSAYGENSREEKDLVELCREDSPFDIINIGFVERFFDESNLDRLPGLNFAGHCNTPIDANHKTLFSCPVIERGIRTCQQSGKRVLIAIGGPRTKGRLDGESQGEKFAENIWNLFLGGEEMPDLRPFSSAACDGVNILIPGGSFVGYAAFIRHLFYLKKRDRTRNYLITASPSCNFPDSVLGPAPNKALETSVKYINHLYVRFYGSTCGVAGNSLFEESLDAWMDFAKRMLARDGEAPLIFVGVPAMDRASPVTGCYQTTRDLREIYRRLRDNKFFGGFMVWDASWDQTNVQYGKTFAERLQIAALNVEEQEQENFDEDEEEEHPIEPPPTEATTPITLPTTQVTYSTGVLPQPVVTTPPPTLPPSTEAPPPTEPAPRPPDSPDEDPYGNDNEMEQGNAEPPEQEEPSPPVDEEEPPEDEEEQQQPEQEEEEQQPDQEEEQAETQEGEPPQGDDAQEPTEDENGEQEEDPGQPTPPDMENRYPDTQPEPDNDEKAYQEESIPFSNAAKLLAAKAEKEWRRKQWLRLKKKEEWLKMHQSQHQPIVPINDEKHPTYNYNTQQNALYQNSNTMSQNPNVLSHNLNTPSNYPQQRNPLLSQVSKYPVMPFGFYSKQHKILHNINKNRQGPDELHKVRNNQVNTRSNQPGSTLTGIPSSGSGLFTKTTSGSGSGSGSGFGLSATRTLDEITSTSGSGSGEGSGLEYSGSGADGKFESGSGSQFDHRDN